MDSGAPPGLDGRIAAVRRFNRWYTRTIGLLQEGFLDTRFSLTEARVLYELANRVAPTASTLSRDLALDPGYLSRILQRFEQEALVTRTQTPEDRRRSEVTLTKTGRAAFEPLDIRSRHEIGKLLSTLAQPAQEQLVQAMTQIETLLGGTPSPWVLRSHEPGDIGWVVSRHGTLYAAEYGFDARFEALVAKVAGAFLASHDPARERCWIAERNGVRLGSVFLVRETDALAKLRLLIVEPAARGLGIGQQLVSECIAFARAAGYRRITLWTNDVLIAARRIYQKAGFRLVRSHPHSDFGPAIVGEDWELSLD
ncbi:MAG: MarR family transcriptional regulator [Acetobacteraceae bacterium]|nr:MarR family transcriptional regulator [Acetobacteraceae bacterium]